MITKAQLVALAACLLSAAGLAGQASAQTEPRAGVFYFPGWKDDALGLAYPKPWAPIRVFPEREPMLGWYDEGRQEVMDQQLVWMQSYGIGFVVFDWYWSGRHEMLAHALAAYHTSSKRRQVPYAVMWANHGGVPKTIEDFNAMGAALVNGHFKRPEYLKIDGKPVLFIQVPENLEAKAKAAGSDTATLLAGFQKQVREAGMPGVLLVAGAGGGPGQVTQAAKQWGYGAYFSYNYHAGIGGRTKGSARYSFSYEELDEGYREHWDWFLTKADMPYVLPMTAGWDKRPWGGSKDPRHDQSTPTQAQFLAHLRAGRDRITAHPDRTFGLGVICCWNEFGEGSIVEPTKVLGFQRLEAVKSVFGRP